MKTLGYLGATLFLATPCYAQGFTGGEVGYEYNQHNDDRSRDGITYFASAQYGLNQRFSASVDLSYFDTKEDVAAATVHGIFHINDASSVGVFYTGFDNDSSLTGIEGAIEILGGVLAVYVGEFEDDFSSATVIGIDSDAPWFGTPFTIYTEFDIFIDGDDVQSTNEIGIAYDLDRGMEVFAQFALIEQTDGVTSSSDSYFGVGSRIALGPNGGTTFERR